MKSSSTLQARRLSDAYAKVSRHIIPLMLLAYIVAYLDRINVGFAKLQMLGALGFSESIYGLGAGIFFLGYFIFGVPSNFILQRLGARVWIAVLMISWGIISGATMWVKTPVEFCLMRFLLGVAEAGFFPGVIYYFTEWYPTDRRGKIIAMFMSAIAIGSMIGSVISGGVMQSFGGAYGWAGWQWLFLLEAAPAVVVGLCIVFFTCDNIGSASWLHEDERMLLTVDLARDSGSKPQHSFVDAFYDRRVWIASAIYFCVMMGLYGISFWLPTIIFDMGIKRPLHIGLVTAIPYGVAAVGMVLMGRSADSRDERRWHVAIPAVVGAGGLILSAVLATHTVMALAALSGAAFGILTAAPLFWCLPTAYLSGPAAAAGIAIINSSGCLAGFASPYIVGVLEDLTNSTNAGMYCIAAFLLVSAGLVVVAISPEAVKDSHSR